LTFQQLLVKEADFRGYCHEGVLQSYGGKYNSLVIEPHPCLSVNVSVQPVHICLLSVNRPCWSAKINTFIVSQLVALKGAT